MNAYVLRIASLMDILMQCLLVENTSLAETRVVGVSPVSLQNRYCRNHKKLDYEIETVNFSLIRKSTTFAEIIRNSITGLKLKTYLQLLNKTFLAEITRNSITRLKPCRRRQHVPPIPKQKSQETRLRD